MASVAGEAGLAEKVAAANATISKQATAGSGKVTLGAND